MIVICTDGVLATVAVPAYGGYVNKVKEEVCSFSCMQLTGMYEIYLEMKRVEHTDVVFEGFVWEK